MYPEPTLLVLEALAAPVHRASRVRSAVSTTPCGRSISPPLTSTLACATRGGALGLVVQLQHDRLVLSRPQEHAELCRAFCRGTGLHLAAVTGGTWSLEPDNDYYNVRLEASHPLKFWHGGSFPSRPPTAACGRIDALQAPLSPVYCPMADSSSARPGHCLRGLEHDGRAVAPERRRAHRYRPAQPARGFPAHIAKLSWHVNAAPARRRQHDASLHHVQPVDRTVRLCTRVMVRSRLPPAGKQNFVPARQPALPVQLRADQQHPLQLATTTARRNWAAATGWTGTTR